MNVFWKWFWDIVSAAAGLYAGYKVFLYSGSHIPALGYIPIGLALGLLTLGIVARLVYIVDFSISWILWKLFKIRTENDLPY